MTATDKVTNHRVQMVTNDQGEAQLDIIAKVQHVHDAYVDGQDEAKVEVVELSTPDSVRTQCRLLVVNAPADTQITLVYTVRWR